MSANRILLLCALALVSAVFVPAARADGPCTSVDPATGGLCTEVYDGAKNPRTLVATLECVIPDWKIGPLGCNLA